MKIDSIFVLTYKKAVITIFPKYLRVQTRYCGRTGKPVGIFTACWHLLRAEKLSDDDKTLFLKIESWFVENLLKPEFYENGNEIKGTTWFKRIPSEHLVKELEPLMALLDKYGVKYDVVLSNYPGDIIYEDDYQVGVI